MDRTKFSLYGNKISPAQDRKALEWQQMFVEQFDYDPDEHYELSVHDNPQLGEVLGIRDIGATPTATRSTLRAGVVISTIRMGYGHYRIAMAGASAARAMGRTPYWLDLLAIPGITRTRSTGGTPTTASTPGSRSAAPCSTSTSGSR